MSTQNTSDEVSIGELGGVFRKLYHFFLIRTYRIFRFFLKSWYIVLALVLIGGILGYFQTKDRVHPKKGELLVQINYRGANYIYQTIDLLSAKIKESDTAFFKENNLFSEDHFSIKKIKIEPVINLNSLLQRLPEYSRPFELLVEETKTKDPLMASEVFRDQYRVHRIKLETSAYGNKETVEALLTFLNNHPAFRDTKEIYLKNLDFQIKETKVAIQGIDSLFHGLGASSLNKPSGSQMVVNAGGNSFTELHLLLQEKSKLVDQLELLEIDRIHYDEAVVLKSYAALVPNKGFFANRTLWLPIIFLMAFSGFSMLWYLLDKGKKLSDLEESQNS